jgi:hypothetical protein
MEALLSEPPLTYNAARAKPLEYGTENTSCRAIAAYHWLANMLNLAIEQKEWSIAASATAGI